MKTIQTFDALTNDFRAYLEQIRRREPTIQRYAQLWARIKIFMDSRRMSNYDKQVGEAYLHKLFGNFTYSQISKYNQVIVNSVAAPEQFSSIRFG